MVETSKGMIAVMEVLEHHTRAEKYAILSAVFNCMYNNKLKETYSVSDIMEIVDTMRFECKRTLIPEFGGAERFIQGEL